MIRPVVAAIALIFVLAPLASPFSTVPAANSASSGLSARVHEPLPGFRQLEAIPGAFSFVSNFEDGRTDGWASVSGIPPAVSSSVLYSGEPSLSSTAGPVKAQIDTAKEGFVAGEPFLSFQVAIDAGKGTGVFGLGVNKAAVAVVGVSNGEVVAGPGLGSLETIEAVPTGTAYPAGWVYLLANVSASGGSWVMNVFVDGTARTAATVAVPGAGSYANAIIETTSGTVYYSDIVVSTVAIPIYLDGYNQMEGYGQGSGGFVNFLPAYDDVTAQMNLDSWSTPQFGILSFQINAMNYTGTVNSTCVGFFQLGIDLDPRGIIAPWYVRGDTCEAVYFLRRQSIATPQPTHLVLSIVDDQAAHAIRFTIRDTTIGKVFTATIPYSGSPFDGMYTQAEFQPCCNEHPIQDYRLAGSLYGIHITTLAGRVSGLPAGYMIPFVLDAPPSWDFTYYQGSTFGYQQVT